MDVRFELRVLEVRAVGKPVSDDGDSENERGVLQSFPVYGTHGAGYRRADKFADAAVLVDPWCAVGVAVVAFGLEHDARVIVASAGHVACFASADDLCEVVLSGEEDFDVLVQASATVVAGVDDDALAFVVFSEDVAVDGAERIVVHSLDVHISEAPAREAVDQGFAVLHPSAVEKIVLAANADREHRFVPFSCLSLKRHESLSASLSVEELGDVRSCGELFAVDGSDAVAGFHFAFGTVKRSAFEHFGDGESVGVRCAEVV